MMMWTGGESGRWKLRTEGCEFVLSLAHVHESCSSDSATAKQRVASPMVGWRCLMEAAMGTFVHAETSRGDAALQHSNLREQQLEEKHLRSGNEELVFGSLKFEDWRISAFTGDGDGEEGGGLDSQHEKKDEEQEAQEDEEDATKTQSKGTGVRPGLQVWNANAPEAVVAGGKPTCRREGQQNDGT
eukprot:CAMPEP_0206481772 /NCGR_PEP_ID=MMETSP0324_2-20121206/38382_1 /ASSEMBLY_ACC=CAM_ASM_000836 /TAXON_ID=2866 /ORGANISM="Crypthecodinium cohnii, Strain Seligo" /LENGTH=185 /DNA_ID=CAMNT_0053959401 /DNA_START=134 /DNA_END=693 /DNA_ORIENTATION=+